MQFRKFLLMKLSLSLQRLCLIGCCNFWSSEHARLTQCSEGPHIALEALMQLEVCSWISDKLWYERNA